MTTSRPSRAALLLRRVMGKLRQVGGEVLADGHARVRHWADRTRERWGDAGDRKQAQQAFQREEEADAARFLASGETLELPAAGAPALSVALTLSGESVADLAALRGLAALGRGLAGTAGVEVFVVGPPPAAWGVQARGVTVIDPQPGAYDRFARAAQGECLLFLGGGARLLDSSPDTGEPLPGNAAGGAAGARAALDRLRGSAQPGAVTGRLLGADGRLFPGGRAASSPEAMFAREVDSADADALFVLRERFLALGGFGPADDPAVAGAVRGAAWGRRAGVAWHEPTLLAQRPAGDTAVLNPEEDQRPPHRRDRPRVLLVEDRVPYPWLGAGYPRSAELLAALVEAGCAVTLFPTQRLQESWAEVRRVVDETVEVMLGRDRLDFPRFWRERAGSYDLCIVCRPHNMARLRGRLLARRDGPPVVYDAEALYCLRGLAWRRHMGLPTSAAYARRRVAQEARLARGSAAVLSVSGQEAERFREGLADGRGGGPVPRFYVLRHTVPVAPTPARFDARRGLLFVGSLHAPRTPNADSMDWFLREILPRLRAEAARAGQEPPGFRLAGSNLAGLDFSGHPGVEVLGRVEDLGPVYDRARVFVAPTRYSAGVPLKVYEAAGRGVPAVVTPLLADQLGWTPGEDFLVAEDAAGFAEACLRLHGDAALWEALRAGALRRVETECSAAGFRDTVRQVVRENCLTHREQVR